MTCTFQSRQYSKVENKRTSTISNSAASKAVCWYVLFGVSKNHRRKRFLGSWLKSKVAQRPRFRGIGGPQIRPPRLSEAIRGQKLRRSCFYPVWRISNQLLSTQNVNVACFARIVLNCWMRLFLWFSNTVPWVVGKTIPGRHKYASSS